MKIIHLQNITIDSSKVLVCTIKYFTIKYIRSAMKIRQRTLLIQEWPKMIKNEYENLMVNLSAH